MGMSYACIKWRGLLSKGGQQGNLIINNKTNKGSKKWNLYFRILLIYLFLGVIPFLYFLTSWLTFSLLFYFIYLFSSLLFSSFFRLGKRSYIVKWMYSMMVLFCILYRIDKHSCHSDNVHLSAIILCIIYSLNFIG